MKNILIVISSLIILTGCEAVDSLKLLTDIASEEFVNNRNANKQCPDPQFWFTTGFKIGAVGDYADTAIDQRSTCEYYHVKIVDDFEQQWEVGYKKSMLEKVCLPNKLYQFGVEDVPSYTDNEVSSTDRYHLLINVEKYCLPEQRKNLLISFYQGKVDKTKKNIEYDIKEIANLKTSLPQQEENHAAIQRIEEYIVYCRSEIQNWEQMIEELSKP